MSMTDREAFEVFASKGPVSIDPSQIKAKQAFDQIHRLFLPGELEAIMTAKSHALDCREGRGEFDEALNKVRERLGFTRD